MKKIIFNFLLAVICIMAFSLDALAQDNTLGTEFEHNGVRYKITRVAGSSKGRLSVIAKDLYATTVSIPAEFTVNMNSGSFTFQVNTIEANAFNSSNCADLKNLTISMYSGYQIATNAFNGCTIENLNIRTSIVAGNAFTNATITEATIKINGNGQISSNAFNGSNFGTLTVRSQNAGQRWKLYAGFSGITCDTLNVYDVDDNTTNNNSGFPVDRNLAAGFNVDVLTIGPNTTITGNANTNDYTLKSLIIENGCTIDNSAFERYYKYVDGGDQDVIYPTSLSKIRIGDNVTIGDGAFRNQADLTELTIGDRCTIGAAAFRKPYLKKFINTSSLSKIVIGNNVNIGDSAFANQAALRELTIGTNCTMGFKAFRNTFRKKIDDCTGFDYEPETAFVTIGEGCTAIPSDAFAGAVYLDSVNLPNSVKTIGESAFAACQNLKSINIPTSLISIGAYAFKALAVEVENEEDLLDIVLPDAFQSLGEYAFAEARIKSIDLGKSITEIPAYCFAADVDPGDDNRSKCGNAVPHYESHLTSLIIPNTVTSIGEGALSECDVLDSIVIHAIVPPTLADNNVLGGLATFTKIHVPCEAVSRYKSASLWDEKKFQIMGQIPFPTYIDYHFSTTEPCDCYGSFIDKDKAEITIANDGAMYLPDMLGQTVVNENVENFNITIIKNMNKEAWNLIGGVGELKNMTYHDFLGTFGGNFDFAGLPYYDNKWESDLKDIHKQNNYPNPEFARGSDQVIANQSFLVWPFPDQWEIDTTTGERPAADGSPQYGMKVSVASNQLQEFKANNGEFTYEKTWSANATDLDEQNNHTGYFYALYNPYVGLLNINKFITANASQIQGGKVYFLNSTGDNFLAHDAANITEIAPARGFLVATTDDANKKISITMNNDMLVKTATKVNNSKAGRYDGKMTFTAEANNTVHRVVARMDAGSDNGFDNKDAYIIISSDNDNYVEPYFLVDNRNIYENVFQTLPYEAPINFNARKQSDVYFYAKNIPDSIEVSIIDIANQKETILENGEDFNFTAEVGTNANRYKIKFAKKKSTSSIAEVENIEVRFTQTANEINVFADGLQSIEIINTLGQTVKQTNDSKVNISDLQSGAYVIKIQTNNGTAKDKFIK